jgi:hypothetical protein
LGTLLARMQLANASPDPPAPEAAACVLRAPRVVDPAVVAAPELAVVYAEMLAPPTVAAVGLGELPPHPATRTPLVNAATPRKRARLEQVSRFRWMLSDI